MKAKKHILYYFLLLCLSGFSQSQPSPFKIWQLTALSGEASLRGNYKESEANINNYYTKQNGSYLNGVFQVSTQSFFVHPNFMLLNLSATYNPQTRRDNYLTVPDYTEKINTEGVDASARFFSKKKIKLTTSAIINTSIMNIENLTKVKSKNKQFVSTLSYSNKILPITISYTLQKSEQKTIGSDRKFNFDQRIIQGSTGKSFTSYDNHSFSYMHSENTSSQNDPNINVTPLRMLNSIDLVELTNDIIFDLKKNYSFNSLITNSNQQGSLNFKKFQANERLELKLPVNFLFASSYNLGISQQELTKNMNQGIHSTLSHQLYKSLYSSLFFDKNQAVQDAYKLNSNKIGVNFNYIKKIPKGKLTMVYTYYKDYQNVKTTPSILNSIHDGYMLTDNQIILLKNQNIDIQSVVVKNMDGTIIYQLNIDYLLIDKSPYIEIVRIPGGLIANNSIVYIDYTSTQAGLYKYAINNNSFAADVLLFKDKLNVYYKVAWQDYDNSGKIENQVFNYYTRYIFGARLNFYFIKGGIEYEYTKSSILPYQGVKYFINFQKTYKKVFLTLNGNLQDSQMANENVKRQDMDLTCKIAYSIFKNVKLDFDYMYRSMKGRGIDVDLTTSKFQMTSNIKRLFFSIGAELYWNKDVNNKTNFKGLFIQLTRKF